MLEASDVRSRLRANRRETRNFLGWVLLAVLTLGITALLNLPWSWMLSGVSVFLLASCIELLVAIFGFPTALRELFPGVLLLALCGWLLATDGSPLLLVAFAFASGWILHATTTSFR